MAGFDNNESAFIVGVSQGTGIDPRVVAAWVYQEGAFRQGGTGGYNYLNITPFQGDKRAAVSQKGFSQFSSVQDSINATVTLLHQPQYATIVSTAKARPSPKEQIAAISHSPWSADHYGPGGVNLLKTMSGLFGIQSLSDSYVGPSQAKAVASTLGTGSASDWTSIDMTNIGGAITGAENAIGGVVNSIISPFQSIGDFLKWISGNWDRILIVIGGAVMLILGAKFAFESQKSNTGTFTFAKAEG